MLVTLALLLLLYFKGLVLVGKTIKWCHYKSQGVELMPEPKPLTAQERELQKAIERRQESEAQLAFINGIYEESVRNAQLNYEQALQKDN